MESSSAFQPTEVPNSQVNPSPNPPCFHQHPVHCFHQYHYHWVYPPFIFNHVPVPRCPGHSLPFASSSSPIAISPKTNESLPAHNQPNESPVQSNATNTVSAKQETHNKDTATATATSYASIGYQSPRVQCPCFFVSRHPVMHMHAPVCPNHHLLPSRGHGYWQSPCMMPGRPPCLPFPCCPMPHIPSMPLSCPANTVYGEPDLNTMEAFPGHAEGEQTASHIGAEIWHREAEIQAYQDCGMENAYELEEEEEEEEEPIFVLTDEWMEFFAKSEARRQQKKKQQQKEAKKLRKAARFAPKKNDGEVEISDSCAHSADPSSSAFS